MRSHVSGKGSAWGLIGAGRNLRVLVPDTAKDLVMYVNKVLKQLKIMRAWTSLQFNWQSVCGRHRDTGNIGPSMILGLGKYSGGHLVIEGTQVDILNSAVVFNGHLEHWSEPFVGDRWSIVAYSHEVTEKGIPMDLQQTLKDLGFPLAEEPSFDPPVTEGESLLRVGLRGNALIRSSAWRRPPPSPEATQAGQVGFSEQGAHFPLLQFLETTEI